VDNLSHTEAARYELEKGEFSVCFLSLIATLVSSCLRLLQSAVKKHAVILLLRSVLSPPNIWSLLMKLP